MSPTTLLLPTHVRETLVSEASDGAPEEVCGVLLGTDRESETIHVSDSRPVPNVADDPRTRYELDPATTAQVFASVEDDEPDTDRPASADATEVVGFYHSHPRGPAGPSATDRAQAQWPEYVYLIVSLAEESGADIGAWRWTGDEFESLSVESNDTESA